MANSFFTRNEFNNKFSTEKGSAIDVYERRKKSGIPEYALAIYDFIFISDTEEKLASLSSFLKENYSYEVREIAKGDNYWKLAGESTEFPVDENNLMYWALDMYCKGYEFDCKLDGYGAMTDPDDQKILDLKSTNADYYFELAMDAYHKKNLGMAIIHFSTSIKIDPTDPNAWYSRAFMKDELYTRKAARRDYDKAIELAPNFTDAIINRAANKDMAGEYEEAISDYDRVIELDPESEMAYFNRGNSKLNINDRKGACEDWNKAKELGADYAQKRIDQHCQ